MTSFLQAAHELAASLQQARSKLVSYYHFYGKSVIVVARDGITIFVLKLFFHI